MTQKMTMPPNDPNAENAVVAGLMIDPGEAFKVAQIITPADFYQVAGGQSFGIILDLVRETKPVDVLMIESEAARRGLRADEVGQFIADAMTAHSMTVGAGFNVEEYARIIRANARRRRAIDKAQNVARMAFDPETAVDDVVRYMQGAALEIAGLDAEEVSTTEAAAQWFAEFEEMVESGRPSGLRTGIVEFDRAALLRPKRFVIFAAPPGGGKSTMMKRIGVSVARVERRPVAIFTLEMTAPEYIEMVAAEIAGVDVSPAILLKPRAEREADLARVRAAMTEIYRMTDKTLFIFDEPNITPAEIAFKCQALRARLGDLALVVVDYAQLVTPDRTAKDGTRQDEVAAVSRALKGMAKGLDVPVIAGSQLNDAGQVRESRALQQDADVVVMMKPDGVSLEISYTKFRRGSTAPFLLKFDKATSRIVSIALPQNERDEVEAWNRNAGEEADR